MLRDRITGHGDLPGGRFGIGEIYKPWKESIDRELKEELGADILYRIDEEPLFVFPHRIESGGHEALGIAYHADYQGGEIVISDEHDVFSWVSIKDYDPALHFIEHMLEAVLRFQNAAPG